jgi:hypothetical protein
MVRSGKNPVFFIIAIVSALIVIYSAPCRAATIDAAGAAHLKTVFSNLLSDKARHITSQGSKLVMDGDVMVEPASGYYAVTLPHLSVVAADNSRVDIGMIAVNVIPDDKPDQWKMSLALPTPLTWRDAQGAEKVKVEIGKQNFAGIWNEKLQNFTKLKAEYKDIKVNTPDKQFLGAANAVTLIYDLNQGSDGHWSGPVNYAANGIVLAMGDGTAVSIGKLEAASSIQGYAFDAVNGYSDKLTALTSKISSGVSMPPDQRLALYNTATEMFGALFDSMSMKFTAENIVVTHPVPQAPGTKISLGDAGLDMGFSGFRQDKVSIQLGLHYNGLAIEPPPGFSTATPDKFNVAVSIDNIPYKALVDLGRKALAPDPANPQAAAALMAGVPQVLQNAGVTINLHDLSSGNTLYNGVATGVLNCDAKAAKTFTGKARAEIAGLERLTAALNAQMKDPQVPDANKQGIQQIAGVVAMMQVFGQQGTNKSGQSVRTYDFELTQQGQILLNGADINTLFGGQGSPAAGMPSPAPAPAGQTTP